MKVHSISIIPIEYFTYSNAKKALKRANRYYASANDTDELKVYNRLMGNPIAYLDVPSKEAIVRILFDQTSTCLMVWYVERITNLDFNIAHLFLSRRSILHDTYIRRDNSNPLLEVIERLTRRLPDNYKEIWPTYVFSFTIIQCDENKTLEEHCDTNICKIISEPSMAAADDLLPRHNLPKIDIGEINHDLLRELTDCDLAHHTTTYITWATITCCTDGTAEEFEETRALLIGLETRLQIIWNRCYEMSILVNDIIDKKIKERIDSESIIVSFARAVDDARGVLSSTISTRGQNLFKQMVVTSNIHQEIERLERKLDLMDKYIQRQREQKQRQYTKSVEMLLFVVAATSVIDALVGLPVFEYWRFIAWEIGLVIIALFAIIGYLLILRRP